MDIKDTKSYENLKISFAGEAEAIVRYYIYAQNAKQQGYNEAAELFEKMAKNELEHAKVWFKFLYPEELSVEESIKEVAYIENHEWKDVYPRFAEIAKEEGLKEVADMFGRISAIECEHERRFVDFHLNFIANKDNIKEEKAKIVNKTVHCIFCGFPSEKELEICPVCGASDSFKI